MDLRIRIRIHIKMSWIRNTDAKLLEGELNHIKSKEGGGRLEREIVTDVDEDPATCQPETLLTILVMVMVRTAPSSALSLDQLPSVSSNWDSYQSSSATSAVTATTEASTYSTTSDSQGS
jgi:hypothetical protein